MENETISEQVTQFNSRPPSMVLQAQILSQLMKWGNGAWPESPSATEEARSNPNCLDMVKGGFSTTFTDGEAETEE